MSIPAATHLHALCTFAVVCLVVLTGCGDGKPSTPPPAVGGSTGMNPAPDEEGPEDAPTHDAEAHGGPHAHQADEVGPPPVDVGPAIRYGPKGGILARLSRADDPDYGWLEIRLDAASGRVALWLARDPDMTEPLALPVSTNIALTLVEHEDRRVTLRPADAVANVDTSGQPTVRDGKTHYFVFPAPEAAPPAWLRDPKLDAVARLSLLQDRIAYVSDDFALRPAGDAKASK